MRHDQENLIGKKYGHIEVLREFGRTKDGRRTWECLCTKCNKKIIKITTVLTDTRYPNKSCGCQRYDKLVGKRFGHLLVIARVMNKTLASNGYRKSTLWKCRCDCGKECIRSNSSLKYPKFKENRTCGCQRNGKNINTGKMPNRYYNRAKWGAIKRDLAFEITKNDMWKLFVKQKEKCALTGLNIRFSRYRNDPGATASLDRKDSKKGYIKDNIQWVYKNVNKMKQDFNQNHFIKICNLIAKQHPR